MADEISKSTLLKVTKGNLSIQPAAHSYTVTMAGTDAFHGTQNVTTGTSQAMAQGSITALGEVFIRNLALAAETTKIAQVLADGNAFATLPPGASCQFRAVTGQTYTLGTAVDTQVEIFAIEA